jgi:hypothetical protein
MNPEDIKTSACVVSECMTGGLGKLIGSEDYLECTDARVEREGCSVINDQQTVLKTFLTNVKHGSKSTNLLHAFEQWISKYFTAGLTIFGLVKRSEYQSIAEFWEDFEACSELINDELGVRVIHLDSHRIRQLSFCSQSCERFKAHVYQSVCFVNQNNFFSQELPRFYFLFKYTKNHPVYEFKQVLQQSLKQINKSFASQGIAIDERGHIDLNQTNLILQEFVRFNKLLEPHTKDAYFVEHYVQSQLKTLIESMYYDPAVFDFQTANHVTCVEIDSNTQDIKSVRMNYTELAAYIRYHSKFQVHPKFLQAFIEANNKSLMYKSCFYGLVKHSIQVMRQLCSKLNTLEMDEDIRMLLQDICTKITGGGGSAILQNWSFTPEIEAYFRQLVPSINKTYKQLFETTKSSKIFQTSTYRGSGDFFKDLRMLKEGVLIDLFIFHENQWTKFEQEFAVRKLHRVAPKTKRDKMRQLHR